jgi:hypothetical protein
MPSHVTVLTVESLVFVIENEYVIMTCSIGEVS